MKLKLFYLSVIAFIFALSSCSTEVNEVPDVQQEMTTNTEIDFRQTVKKQYGEFTFMPHKGRFIHEGMIVQYFPEEVIPAQKGESAHKNKATTFFQ